MIAIYCETPFQLIVALNVAYELMDENDKMDLYIVKDMYKSVNQFLVQTKHSRINNVFYVRRTLPERTLFTRIKQRIMYGKDRVLHLFVEADDIKKFPEYSFIISIKYNAILKYMCRHLIKGGKVYFTEEGIGEYLCGNENNIIEEQKLHKYIGGRYLLLPELALDKKSVALYQNPYLNNKKEFKDLLKSIFSYEDEMQMYSGVIFFEQPFGKDYQYPEYNAIEERICKELYIAFSESEISFKAHPRTEKKQNSVNMIYGTNPWECIVNDMADIDERVLVTMASTAVITPKILCNKEPYVIVLIHFMKEFYETIENGTVMYERSIRMFEYVKSIYKKDKFYVPKTMEEYRCILKNIKENA